MNLSNIEALELIVFVLNRAPVLPTEQKALQHSVDVLKVAIGELAEMKKVAEDKKE